MRLLLCFCIAAVDHHHAFAQKSEVLSLTVDGVLKWQSNPTNAYWSLEWYSDIGTAWTPSAFWNMAALGRTLGLFHLVFQQTAKDGSGCLGRRNGLYRARPCLEDGVETREQEDRPPMSARGVTLAAYGNAAR